jgi:hypothetical protein
MPTPQPGDILIRGLEGSGFELLEATTFKHLAGPFESFAAAIAGAFILGSGIVWEQGVDSRGRPFSVTTSSNSVPVALNALQRGG